jgi:hypothetical protein
MSFPGPGWSPSPAPSTPINPRAAFSEWLLVCDEITRSGGRIFLIDPPSPPAPPQDPVRAAALGALFPQPHVTSVPVFLRARGDATSPGPAPGPGPGQNQEQDPISSLLSQAGLNVRLPDAPFSGQPDVIALGRNRFLLTFPEGKPPAVLAQVKDLLPQAARVLEVALKPPFRHGTQCLCPLWATSGDAILLLNENALASCSQADVARFVGKDMEVCPLTSDDAEARVCSSLSVRGRALLPTGVSTTLRGRLVRCGLTLCELELPQLFHAAGLGPRDLVNELTGFVLSDTAPSYALRREALHRLAASYPETTRAS